jgi:hypothetical protein
MGYGTLNRCFNLHTYISERQDINGLGSECQPSLDIDPIQWVTSCSLSTKIATAFSKNKALCLISYSLLSYIFDTCNH